MQPGYSAEGVTLPGESAMHTRAGHRALAPAEHPNAHGPRRCSQRDLVTAIPSAGYDMPPAR
jgi:hypothetical protein